MFVPVQCFLLVLSMFFMYKLEITSYLQDPFIPFQFLLLMIGLLILNMVGVIDDLIRINYRRKFVAQIVASSFLPLSGLWINDLYGLLGITTLSPWIGMPLTVFVAVFIINAVNLIDGIDGLCSGLVGMGALVLVSCLFIMQHGYMLFLPLSPQGCYVLFLLQCVRQIERKTTNFYGGYWQSDAGALDGFSGNQLCDE